MWYSDSRLDNGNGIYIAFFNNPDRFPWGIYDSQTECCIVSGDGEGNVLMQFTGLQDIAKADCYEGDIIKAVWSEDINDEIFGIGKVAFYCGCFMIEWIDDKDANMELLGMIYKTGRPRTFKIFGNIFENPDLIK
jgi:uncharacterized phage protein (TIGR01671 family)